MKSVLLASVAFVALAGAMSSTAAQAACPPVTVADPKGITGEFPQQFELSEFQGLANCTLSFSENPDISALNKRIIGNPDTLPPVAERLPAEPLVVAPYEQIGQYGGVLDGLSNATEAGTSDLLSVRHVNLVRFSDDLVTVVPNIAKSWSWNSDFTELTLNLRRGHKWSDGAPFTAEDVVFWYDNITRDKNVVEKPRDVWSAGGEPITVTAPNLLTVKFSMQAPKPGLLSTFATDYAQPFLPKHFLGVFHPAINKDADTLAKEAGFENGYEVIKFYYGGSDWKDVPSPYLKDADKIAKLPAAVLPTLESHIVVKDSTEDRVVVANPYFHMVDTAGNQLPYINEINEVYVPDNEVRILKMVNGEVDYKSQSVTLPDAPTLLDNQEKGGYTVELRPQIAFPVFSFNLTSADEEKRAIFSNKDFRVAMSHAMNRPEINNVAFFDLGTARQFLAFDPVPDFATPEQVNYATAFDLDKAKSMLDSVGLMDKDGDGFRDLPSGKKLTLNLQFSTQGVSTAMAELVAQHWTNAGVQTTIKEVTSDEYRAAQSANELDILVWSNGQPIPVIQGDNKLFVPPFGDYFTHRPAMLWAQYIESNGAEGLKPPAWVDAMREKITEWQQYAPGSEQSNALGRELIQMQLDAFIAMGSVQSPNPIYRTNKLVNFETPKTWSYEYYRTYPYRGHQWSLTE